MKRIVLIILTISLLMLSGCAQSEEQVFLKFADSVANAESVSFKGHVTAEYSMLSAKFDLGFSEKDGEAVIEVLTPEIIKGIKARVKDGETSLEYEGAMLDLGTVGDSWLSPMSSLPIMFRAIKDAHLELAWDEDDLLVARLVPEDDMTVTIWLDTESMTPKTAEITYKDNTAAYIEISDWTLS